MKTRSPKSKHLHQVKLKLSTARKGDPLNASRGAAAERARQELSDAVDKKLELEVISQEQARIECFASVIGMAADSAQIRKAIASARLGQLQQWIKQVQEATKT